MQPIQVSTVILGNWNPKIFTPEWIKINLLGKVDGEKIEGLVNFRDLEFAFKYGAIVLSPKPNSIEINFDGYNPENALLASKIIVKILETLPHTPIRALGVNIKYKSNLGASNISPLVNTINNLNSTIGEFKINQVRKTVERKDYLINVIYDINKSEIITTFNFHYNKVTLFDVNLIDNHYKETLAFIKDDN